MKMSDADLSGLSASQHAALRHIDAVAGRAEVGAYARVIDLLARAGCDPDDYIQALECVRSHARVVVHFHPDRFGHKPGTVAQSLLREGVYRSQFETGLSSGSLSVDAGGERDAWESTLF